MKDARAWRVACVLNLIWYWDTHATRNATLTFALRVCSATLFINYFGLMFPKHGVFLPIYLYLDYIYAHFYFYIAWSTGICQATSVSLLATNRLSAILFPNQYHKIWRGRRLHLIYLIQFLPGCILGLLTFANTAEIYANDNQGIVPKFTNPKWTTIYFSIGGCFLLINCLYLILAYCYLFKVLRNRNKNSQQSSSFSLTILDQNHRKYALNNSERRLFIMCSIIVFVQLTVLLFFLLKLLAIFQLTVDEFYTFYSALSDLFASINPYLLWIFSDSLRKYILQRIGFRTDSHTTPIRSIAPLLEENDELLKVLLASQLSPTHFSSQNLHHNHFNPISYASMFKAMTPAL